MSEQYLPEPAKTNTRGLGVVLGCFGLFALCICSVCCILPVTGTVGVGAVAALFLSNGVSEVGTETIRLEGEGTGRLVIQDGSVKVNIQGGSGNDIVVDYELTVYGWSESAAQSALAKHEVLIERSAGNTVTVSVDNRDTGITFYELQANISVPFEMQDIVLEVSKAVEISNVNANFEVEVQGSDVNLKQANGQFDISTSSYGDIYFTGNFAPASQNQFATDWGKIEVRVLGDAHIAYNMQSRTRTTSSSSNRTVVPQLICPDVVQNLSCVGRLGDATAQVNIESESGDLALYAN